MKRLQHPPLRRLRPPRAFGNEAKASRITAKDFDD